MSAPIGSSSSRYRLESHNPDGSFAASLPYKNIQFEEFMNNQGQSLRCQIPYRNRNITPDNFRPIDPTGGGHEIWLYDHLVSDTAPVFAGPVWSITASSGDGWLAVSAQDALSYLAKRVLVVDKNYDSQPPYAIIQDVIVATNAIEHININNSPQSANAGNVGSLRYIGTDLNNIADILKAMETPIDGTDYYMRCDGTIHQLLIYGGQKKPTRQTRTLEYGGDLANYSVQYNSQSAANLVYVVGSNGIIGQAIGPISSTNLYYSVDRSSDITDVTTLNAAAAVELKLTNAILTTPSIVTKTLVPILDFDLGDQFGIVIDDDYVQYDKTIRAVGWQQTIAQSDDTTVVIYTNDLNSVT